MCVKYSQDAILSRSHHDLVELLLRSSRGLLAILERPWLPVRAHLEETSLSQSHHNLEMVCHGFVAVLVRFWSTLGSYLLSGVNLCAQTVLLPLTERLG